MAEELPQHGRDWTLGQYLERLASDSPTPGGGSAAALVGALAAALGGMVCSFTVGREKFAAVEAEVRTVQEALEEQRAALTDLVQADMDAYAGFRAAYRLAKDDPGRPAAIQEALKASLAVPVAVLERAAAVSRLLPPLLAKGNPNLASDVGCAAALLCAAAAAAHMNVVVNLASITDADFVARAAAGAEALLGEIRETCRRVADETLAGLRGGAEGSG